MVSDPCQVLATFRPAKPGFPVSHSIPMKTEYQRLFSPLPLFAGFILFFGMLCGVAFAQQPGTSPVKVYILMGQSNMVGQGIISSVSTPGTLQNIVVNDPGNLYGFLVDGGGNWVVRDDVWIYDNNGRQGFERSGDPGLGPNASDGRIGPELGFGHKMGDLHGNQVILIKAAWGNRSLYRDFLPPSSRIGGLEPRAWGDNGYYYKLIIEEVEKVTGNLNTYFPSYNGQGYEIAGMLWHQGTSDAGRPQAEYETNMANFIRDIRSDLKVPNCPFVIATAGMSVEKSCEPAQLAMKDFTKYPEFQGNVDVIDTRNGTYLGYPYRQLGSDSPNPNQDFHWYLNARSYLHIGLALGDVMPTLDQPRCPSRLGAASDGSSTGVTLSWQNGTEMPTSVRILRDGVEIAAAAPVSPAMYVDNSVVPGTSTYELQFTMPGVPCDPLTVTHYSGVSDLTAYRAQGKVALSWQNNFSYTCLELTRNGVVIEPSLSGSITSYDDTTAPSSGVLIYQVTPTPGTDVADEVVINLGPQVIGDTVVYEPFDIASGLVLDGAAGGHGLGTWSGGGDIEPFSMEFGELPTAGNRYGGTGATASWVSVGSSLSNAGLLDHGAELWFSFLVQPASSGSNNGFIGLSDATGNFGSGYSSAPAGADLLGFWLEGDDLNLVTASGGTPSGQTQGRRNIALTAPTLMVGKITWGANGAANDTLQLYVPETDRVLPATATASKTVVIDQSTLSHLGVWMNHVDSMVDEIRFGASYDAVIGAGYESHLDFTLPKPAQMSWSSLPAGASDSSVSMTAVTANDENGVEYYFTSTSSGGHDSGWQDSPTYVDTGLLPATAYSYTVQARDKSINHNTNTASSPAASANTFPADTNPPPIPSFIAPVTTVSRTTITVSANPVVDGEGSSVQYRFYNTTLATNSGWLSDPTWTNVGLAPGTTYYYTVQTRDTAASQNQSAQSVPRSATTLNGGVTIASSFSVAVDAATSATYSSSPGSDSGGGDLYTADNPLTINTGSFAAVGKKLVAILSLHNSAAGVGTPTTVTYAGTDMFGNIAAVSTAGNTKQYIMYLDNVTSNGNFVINFTGRVDEVGVQLFALNGAAAGAAYASQSISAASTSVAADMPFSTSANATTGDFIVGIAQKNNGAATTTVNSPYTGTSLTAGNLGARSAYLIATGDGNTAPVFRRTANGSTTYLSYAAFAAEAVPVPPSYDGWAVTNAPTTGDDLSADEDLDGVANGIEFVVGGTSPTGDQGKLPVVSEDGSNMTFSFVRSQASIDSSMALSIEVGDDLSTWPDIHPVPDGALTGSPLTVEKDTSPGMDTVTLSLPLAPGNSKFARLKVTIGP